MWYKKITRPMPKASTMSGKGLVSGKTAEGRPQQRTGTLKRCASRGVPSAGLQFPLSHLRPD